MEICSSTDTKKVMILGAGPLQVPAIQIVKEMGYHTVVCDYDPNACGFQYADEHYVISTIDYDKVLEKTKEIKADFIITSTSDAPVRTVAYVCEKLGLPVDISYENAVCATVKSSMRDRLKEFGVPIPLYYVCSNFEDFFNAVKSFENRECVIKPSDSAASRGVSLISSDLTQSELEEKYEFCIQHSKNKVALVEEYMNGPEVSVECFIVDKEVHIITITDKLVTELPFFVELGHSEPSQLPSEIISKIKEVVIGAIHAIGIENGVSHTEVKITSDGPKIVEVAARLGGDYITSKLVPLSTGVDMVKNSIALALHQEIDIRKTKNCGSAIRFIPGKKGKINHISIDERIKDVPGLVEYQIYVSEGDEVTDTKSSNDRIGHVIACGQDAKEAIANAELALNYFYIEIV